MSTECLTIKNFGPIKKAKLRIRKYNIFIGDTACGKSIAAKLISIFNSEEFLLLKTGDYENFIALLSKYNIDFPFHQDTLISYKYWNISWQMWDDSKLMGVSGTWTAKIKKIYSRKS